MAIARIKKSDDGLLKEANDVVVEFQKELDTLIGMRDDFAQKFPDAKSALDDIFKQEDLVKELVAKAKEKVAAAKESVGPFACTRKFAKPGYDDEVIVTIMVNNQQDAPNIFMSLLKAGALTSIKTDKDVTNAYLSRNPQIEQILHEAWRDRTEMTPSITVPKF